VDSWKKRSAFAGLDEELVGWDMGVLTRPLALEKLTWTRRRAAKVSSTKDSASAISDTMSNIMVGSSGRAIITAEAAGVRATTVAK
jgi:hypothetical protein